MIKDDIRAYLNSINKDAPYNILVIGATHERYEQALCKTGHNFYSLKHGKEWNKKYGKTPDNYIELNYIPPYLNFDLILCHVSGERLDIANDLSSVYKIPVIRHTHTLPQSLEELTVFNMQKANYNSFISEYSKNAWGHNTDGIVINHGIDTSFWNESKKDRSGVLSVVNLWQSRDWACGWDFYQETKQGAPDLTYKVLGENPGLSEPARSIEALRDAYAASMVFLNTSLHSPVPMSLLEAMACGCAVVSTNTCMIPEIIKHGENGLLGSCPEELAENLKFLDNNPDIAAKLGKNARDTIENNYNINAFIEKWNSLFNEAVNEFIFW